jgi:hypothetical protein
VSEELKHIAYDALTSPTLLPPNFTRQGSVPASSASFVAACLLNPSLTATRTAAHPIMLQVELVVHLFITRRCCYPFLIKFTATCTALHPMYRRWRWWVCQRSSSALRMMR